MLQLVILIDGAEVLRRPLAEGRYRLGRGPHNPIVIDDPTVSLDHAALRVEAGQLWLEDLQSSNGSLVNGRAVRCQRLDPADQVQLGRAVLRFEAAPAPAAPAWLQVTHGPAAGRRLALDKPQVAIGHPGLGRAALEAGPDGRHRLRPQGGEAPRLNGLPLEGLSPPLRHGDEIELAGSRLRYEREG